MSDTTTLFRARINTSQMKKAERVFHTLGLKAGDAVSLFFAQVALRNDLPFPITTQPQRLLSDEEQASLWNESLGDY
ncbi:MAG: hypothetical protein A3F67_09190 [Verrucomicrobia bacterium RIFCSPHIGHO2_12_FULL_41_10]|nr:MAG: hypothetical protein A3F67_09190 [Verrucomicrobia bacterium RIFCSPHIGHO2_12_FULL_41_10]HLB34207.1 type II toxin-antitoxin system RelB/DinJ family antitoxin [Chthoniobacterales bacterium]